MYKKYVVAYTCKAVYMHYAVHIADMIAYMQKAVYTHYTVHTAL